MQYDDSTYGDSARVALIFSVRTGQFCLVLCCLTIEHLSLALDTLRRIEHYKFKIMWSNSIRNIFSLCFIAIVMFFVFFNL